MKLLNYLLAFAVGANSLPWDGVKPTPRLIEPDYFAGQAEAPKPTAAPAFDLRVRQAAGDATCGFYEGTFSLALYCLSHYVCATNSLYGMGCCPKDYLDDCALPTTCVGSSAISNYSPAFFSNSYVRQCSDATAPLCITQYMEYDGQFTAYGCGSSKDYTIETWLTSFGTANATLTSSPISLYNAYYSPTASSSSSSSSSSSTSQISTSSPSPSPTSTTVPPPPPTSTSATPSPSSSSSTPIGAIVGGVVGGIAAITAVALLIWFCLRRSRQRDDIDPQAAAAAPVASHHEAKTPAPMVNYENQPQYQYPAQPDAQSPATTYNSTYPDKTAAQATYSAYGSPPLSPNPTVAGGSERASTLVPPYSPQMSEAGYHNSTTPQAAPPQHIAELGSENQRAEL